MDEFTSDAPDWEILKLLREVRRRVRAGNPERFLAHLDEEPRWVAALPADEARVARQMLDATRELARRAIAARIPEAQLTVDDPPAEDSPPLPRRTPEQERLNLALVQEAERVAPVVTAAPRRRRSRARAS